MSHYDITLATCDPLPEPDPDEAPLVDALERAGLTVRVCDWRDPSVDWSKSRITLIRSTWDYYRHLEDFLAWLDHVDEVGALYNPRDIVRWNLHKRYLLELADDGVPVVPTELVACGSRRSLPSICEARGWSRVVVKPAVSAGSYETHIVDHPAEEAAVFARLVAGRDVLVQPYVDAVDTYGERSIVVVDDQITHCIEKRPRFAGQDERVTGPHAPTDDEHDLALRALAAVDASLLYARVDMVPDADGRPMLAELELVEPSLFFRFGGRALARMVAGIGARL